MCDPPARRSELQPVVDEVGHHLHDPITIRLHGRQVCRNAHLEFDLLFIGLPAHLRGDLVDHPETIVIVRPRSIFFIAGVPN